MTVEDMTDKTEEEPQPDAFLSWKDIAPNTKEWHKQSIKYLSDIWPDISSRKAGNKTWGDEVECQIIRFNHDDRSVTLATRQKELLEKLPKNGMFHPEFAKYMIETTPLEPFDDTIDSLLSVEKDLRERRRKINEQLCEEEKLLTLSVFPLLGTEPISNPDDADEPVSNFDGVISDGPYSVAKDNIESRSERQRDIAVPVFRDVNTKLPPETYLNHILFGPGGCGLQATFQCTELEEARLLHDQLVVLGPVFLALTAATPIYQGVLVDTDVRWNQTASAVDDRPDDELEQVAERWSTAPMYLGEWSDSTAQEGVDLCSKLERRVNKDSKFLESRGMDPIMASYFAHLHLRDPLYLAAKAGKQQEVTAESVHRSIVASVWSHVRLKIPEPDEAGMGWRVEFRPMEVQLTDEANAAFLIFLDLVRQLLALVETILDLRMPLPRVRENMNRAHARDAIATRKLWFPVNGQTVELTLDQIVNGGEGFKGLLPLVEETLQSGNRWPTEMHKYLDIIRRRARGEDLTPAQWMRRFIQDSESYKKDSVVSNRACYDMLKAIIAM